MPLGCPPLGVGAVAQAARSARVRPFHQVLTMSLTTTLTVALTCQVAPASLPPPQRGAAPVGSKMGPSRPHLAGNHDCWISNVGLAILEGMSQPLLEACGYEQCCPAPFWGSQQCLSQGPRQHWGFLPIGQIDFHVPFTLEVYFPPITQVDPSLKTPPGVANKGHYPKPVAPGLGLPGCVGAGWGAFKGAVRGFPGQPLKVL